MKDGIYTSRRAFPRFITEPIRANHVTLVSKFMEDVVFTRMFQNMRMTLACLEPIHLLFRN